MPTIRTVESHAVRLGAGPATGGTGGGPGGAARTDGPRPGQGAERAGGSGDPAEPAKSPGGRRRLRSSTIALGSMGVLAAALTSCGSEPDKRCVDRNSYAYPYGYKVVGSQECNTGSSGSRTGGNRKGSSRASNAAWYYDADIERGYADDGTFSRSTAVDRDGFGCSGSGSGGG